MEQKTRLRIQATSSVEADGLRLPDRTREAARRDQNKVALWELRLKAQQLARTADDLIESDALPRATSTKGRPETNSLHTPVASDSS
jgi:hypothetical protein